MSRSLMTVKAFFSLISRSLWYTRLDPLFKACSRPVGTCSPITLQVSLVALLSNDMN